MEMSATTILAAMQAAFPSALKEDVAVVMGLFAGAAPHSPIRSSQRLNLPEGQIEIPYRVYFPEPSPTALKEVTETQASILGCIMTRHHSGYVREAWAAWLSKHPESWTVPFFVQLPGDYVFEIVARIESMLTPEWIALSQEFAAANPEFTKRLSQRIATYWAIYYSHMFPKFRNYPAYRVAEALGLWDAKTAPRLTRDG